MFGGAHTSPFPKMALSGDFVAVQVPTLGTLAGDGDAHLAVEAEFVAHDAVISATAADEDFFGDGVLYFLNRVGNLVGFQGFFSARAGGF